MIYPEQMKQIEAIAKKADAATQIIHDFSNGPVLTEIPTEGGAVPTLKELIARFDRAIVAGTVDAYLGGYCDELLIESTGAIDPSLGGAFRVTGSHLEVTVADTLDPEDYKKITLVMENDGKDILWPENFSWPGGFPPPPPSGGFGSRRVFWLETLDGGLTWSAEQVLVIDGLVSTSSNPFVQEFSVIYFDVSSRESMSHFQWKQKYKHRISINNIDSESIDTGRNLAPLLGYGVTAPDNLYMGTISNPDNSPMEPGPNEVFYATNADVNDNVTVYTRSLNPAELEAEWEELEAYALRTLNDTDRYALDDYPASSTKMDILGVRDNCRNFNSFKTNATPYDFRTSGIYLPSEIVQEIEKFNEAES